VLKLGNASVDARRGSLEVKDGCKGSGQIIRRGGRRIGEKKGQTLEENVTDVVDRAAAKKGMNGQRQLSRQRVSRCELNGRGMGKRKKRHPTL